jgi:hypothetical protein
MATSDDIRYALRIRSADPADRDVFELDPSMAEDAVVRRGARARWRPLIYSWLAILGIVAVGGGVLQRLGPLPATRQAAGGRSDPGPAAPGASFATAYVADPSPPPLAPPPPASPPPASPPPASQSAASPPVASPRPASPQPPPAAPPPVKPAPGVPLAAAPAPIAGPSGARQGNGPDKAPPAGPNGSDTARGKPGEAREPALVVLHPAGPEDGKALAQQLAAKAGLASEQVEPGEPAAPVPRATVRFYANEDHALARRLGNELAGMGYTWQIDNRVGRPPPPGPHPAVDVFLPRR